MDYYKGYFESVYVLLHPFVKPITKVDDIDWTDKNSIIKSAEPISWAEVIEKTQFKTISEVDIGLRSYILGIKEEFCNKKFVSYINDLTEKAGIEPFSEGKLMPLLENKVLEAIKHLGHEWLWLGDELCSERKIHWIDDIIKEDIIPCHGCIFTNNNELLVTTHWDSHCSFLCGSKKDIDKILQFHKFEGFFCTNKTEVYWGLYEI